MTRGAPDDWLERDWLEHEGSSVFGAPRQRVPTPVRPPPHSPPPGGPQAWNRRRGRRRRPGPGPRRATAPMPPTRTWDLAPWAAPPQWHLAPRPGAFRRAASARPATPPGRHGDWRDRARSPPTGPAGRGDRPGPGGSGSGTIARRARRRRRAPGGLVAFLAALVVLPWFTVAGEGVTLADILEAFTVAETDPADLVPGAGDTASTIPPTPSPTPGAVTDAAEQQARGAAGDAAAAALDSASRATSSCTPTCCGLGVAGVVAVAAVVSTVAAPRSAALALLLGVGAPPVRSSSLAGIAHVANAVGGVLGRRRAVRDRVWLGLGGLVAVLAGCAIGPRNA